MATEETIQAILEAEEELTTAAVERLEEALRDTWGELVRALVQAQSEEERLTVLEDWTEALLHKAMPDDFVSRLRETAQRNAKRLVAA